MKLKFWKSKAEEEAPLIVDEVVAVEEPVEPEIPELGTPERVQYGVTERNKWLTFVKEARSAHQAARASR